MNIPAVNGQADAHGVAPSIELPKRLGIGRRPNLTHLNGAPNGGRQLCGGDVENADAEACLVIEPRHDE